MVINPNEIKEKFISINFIITKSFGKNPRNGGIPANLIIRIIIKKKLLLFVLFNKNKSIR